MHKILFLLILTTLLAAQNPKAFSALGDIVYNNIDKIQKLTNIDEYAPYEKKIQEYAAAVKKLKKEGFSLDEGVVKDKMHYLNRLRELSRTNDFFVRSVKRNLDLAIENENSKLFTKLANSGLIDEKRSKNKILDYYFAHSDDVNTTGIIQKYLDEDKKLQAKKERKKSLLQRKKERELEKIQRIRKKDKLEQKKLEEQLNKEVQKKKLQIREEQKKELSKTI
ncbi:hypothetical protein FJR45_01935 [Sulfurimonas sediminis]|uniref:DUF4142 domain-containing protein n=1 Tax=Sulfurimonas sediminis TaxID=2590020 RepID=A0A7M1AZA2_9BACT|nr:hypothetical protein [Sulfurimonas sediminis]QOP42774.1 hypothetical protein FJR45_01935 [Sulfurimonas sediminis]